MEFAFEPSVMRGGGGGRDDEDIKLDFTFEKF